MRKEKERGQTYETLLKAHFARVEEREGGRAWGNEGGRKIQGKRLNFIEHCSSLPPLSREEVTGIETAKKGRDFPPSPFFPPKLKNGKSL